jgi:hypothetical protein
VRKVIATAGDHDRSAILMQIRTANATTLVALSIGKA